MFKQIHNYSKKLFDPRINNLFSSKDKYWDKHLKIEPVKTLIKYHNKLILTNNIDVKILGYYCLIIAASILYERYFTNEVFCLEELVKTKISNSDDFDVIVKEIEPLPRIDSQILAITRAISCCDDYRKYVYEV